MIQNGKPTSIKSKHIQNRYFVVKDYLKILKIQLTYLSTDDMVADMHTKPLRGAKFNEFRDKILNTG